MNALVSIERAFNKLGYGPASVKRNYSFADVLSASGETREVALAAFTQTPESFKSAAFGVLFETGDYPQTRADVVSKSSLGAPIFLSIARDSVGVWRANARGEPALLERVPFSELSRLFERNAARWSPEALHRAKAAVSSDPIQVQYDFVDIGLLQAIEHEVQAKVSVVLDDVVRMLVDVDDSDGMERAAFRATFRLLAAKILVDREHPHADNWDLGDVTSVLSGIELYYNLDSLGSHASSIALTKLTRAWAVLRKSVNLRNISSDSLAHVYETTLVTADTRKLFGTHSTPGKVAEYIIEQLNLAKFDLNSLRIYEPFAGAGVFLVSALRKLRDLLPADWTPHKRHGFLVRRIGGSELDAFACEVAKLSLILADYPNANGWSVSDRDLFLDGALGEALAGANVVLCNPPFEDFTAEERLKYGAAAKASGYSKPKYVLQEILAARPEAIGIVMPHGFLRHERYADLRAQLSATYRRVQLVSLPDRVFGKAEFETALVIASDRRAADVGTGLLLRSVSVEDGDRLSFLQRHKVTSIRETAREAPTSHLWVGNLDELWAALSKNPTLGSKVTVSRGVQWKPKVVTTSSRAQKGFRRGLVRPKGTLSPYAVDPGMTWLNFAPECVLRPSPPAKPWHEPKVLANTKRRSRGLWPLTAAPDDTGLVASQYFFGIWPTDPKLSIDLLAALLNSSIANAFVHENISDQDITNELVKSIPIPRKWDARTITPLVRRYQKAIAESDSSETLATIRQAIDDAVLDAYELDPDLRGAISRYFGMPQARPENVTDLKARAIRRGRQISERDIEQSGALLSAEGVAREFSIKPRTLDAWERARDVLVLPGGRYPTFQFHRGAPLPGMAEVFSSLPEDNPWVLLNFLLRPNTQLGGVRPLDLLRKREVGAVVQVAENLGKQAAL